MKNDQRNLPLFDKIQREYERGLSREYMSSKRKRVAALTEIYEIAMEYQAFKLAKECVVAIDDIIENAKTRGNIQIFQFKQVNQYADMPIKEIKKERVRLLKELEHVKMDNGQEKIDESQNLEVENGE
jgi:hypothetical protein